MTVSVKITAPVYMAAEFGSFERSADLEIAGDFNTLSEGYAVLKTEISELLNQHNAANTLLLNLAELQHTIASKERTLHQLDRKIKTANAQLQRVQNFLERLGINPEASSLLIANGPIGSAVAVEAEVDPIPFDSATDSDNPHEF